MSLDHAFSLLSLDPGVVLAALKGSQREIIQEVSLKKMKSGGLSLPLGFGKTRLGIALGLHFMKGVVLIIVSKTLLASWIDEIKKAFPDLRYEILHKSYLKKDYEQWEPKADTQIVLVTTDVLTTSYKDNHIDSVFVHYKQEGFGPIYAEYKTPSQPFLKNRTGPDFVFTKKWGCIIIDEIQRHTEITTDKCRAISAISSHHRWGLSGTMFDEPKMTRFLGFIVMLHLDGPRELTDMPAFLSSFGGFKKFLVERADNPDFKDRPEYIEEIVTHNLVDKEAAIFKELKTVLNELNAKVKEGKAAGDVDVVRKYSAYILAMFTYVRQALICPLIPITAMYCDMADFQMKSELSQIMTDHFRKIDLESYMQDKASIFSSRFQEIVKKIDKHKDEKCIVFS